MTAASSRRRLVTTLLAALALAGLTVALAACGYSSDDKSVSEGEPVKLGDVTYNVIFSRYLNPADTEDSAYLVGQDPPPEGSNYFGVFFELQNDSDGAQLLPDSFTITDADHQEYDSLDSESLYAFPFGGKIESQEQIPVLDSTPQEGPIEGSLVIFLLSEVASENRPLTLEIGTPDGTGEVTLDL
jgi:hypothetical protein